MNDVSFHALVVFPLGKVKLKPEGPIIGFSGIPNFIVLERRPTERKALLDQSKSQGNQLYYQPHGKALVTLNREGGGTILTLSEGGLPAVLELVASFARRETPLKPHPASAGRLVLPGDNQLKDYVLILEFIAYDE